MQSRFMNWQTFART